MSQYSDYENDFATYDPPSLRTRLCNVELPVLKLVDPPWPAYCCGPPLDEPCTTASDTFEVSESGSLDDLDDMG